MYGQNLNDIILISFCYERRRLCERVLKAKAGLPMLILFTSLYLTAIALIILGGILIAREANKIGGLLLAAGIL